MEGGRYIAEDTNTEKGSLWVHWIEEDYVCVGSLNPLLCGLCFNFCYFLTF